jgi:hypothetical protein
LLGQNLKARKKRDLLRNRNLSVSLIRRHAIENMTSNRTIEELFFFFWGVIEELSRLPIGTLAQFFGVGRQACQVAGEQMKARHANKRSVSLPQPLLRTSARAHLQPPGALHVSHSPFSILHSPGYMRYWDDACNFFPAVRKKWLIFYLNTEFYCLSMVFSIYSKLSFRTSNKLNSTELDCANSFWN